MTRVGPGRTLGCVQLICASWRRGGGADNDARRTTRRVDDRSVGISTSIHFLPIFVFLNFGMIPFYFDGFDLLPEWYFLSGSRWIRGRQ